jgi:hypothetical protein
MVHADSAPTFLTRPASPQELPGGASPPKTRATGANPSVLRSVLGADAFARSGIRAFLSGP